MAFKICRQTLKLCVTTVVTMSNARGGRDPQQFLNLTEWSAKQSQYLRDMIEHLDRLINDMVLKVQFNVVSFLKHLMKGSTVINF